MEHESISKAYYMKEARHNRLYTVRIRLYDILIKTKQKGQKPDEWLPGSRVSGRTECEGA